MAELVAAARSADTEFLVRRASSKGYQWMSIATPPLYTALVLYRRGPAAWSISRFLRATWMGGAAGLAGGAALEYANCSFSDEAKLRARRIKAAYDTSAIRADDHATIGGLLFAMLTPAIFWKRARLPHLILGGAGIGAAFGFWTHYGRNIFDDPAAPAKVPEIPMPTS